MKKAILNWIWRRYFAKNVRVFYFNQAIGKTELSQSKDDVERYIKHRIIKGLVEEVVKEDFISMEINDDIERDMRTYRAAIRVLKPIKKNEASGNK